MHKRSVHRRDLNEQEGLDEGRFLDFPWDVHSLRNRCISVDNTWHQHPGLQCHQRQFRHAGSCVGDSQLQDKIQVKEAGEIAASNEPPG